MTLLNIFPHANGVPHSYILTLANLVTHPLNKLYTLAMQVAGDWGLLISKLVCEKLTQFNQNHLQ